MLLHPVLAHPGAGVLAGPGIEIEVPDPHPASVLRHLEDVHVRVIDRQVVDLLEAQSEQFPRGPEHAVPQPVELQIGLHLIVREIIFRLAKFFGEVSVIPGFDRLIRTFGRSDLLHLGNLFPGPGHGRGPDLAQKVHGRLGSLGHLPVRDPVGEGLVTQQPGLFDPQLQHLGDDRIVVVIAAVVAAARPHLEGFLPQVPARREGDERIHRGAGVGDHPPAVHPPLAGRRGRRLDQVGGQPGEILGALKHQKAVLLVGEDVLAEGGVEARQPLVDLGQAMLLGVGKPGPLPLETLVDDEGQTLLLRRQTGGFAGLVDRPDPLEQGAVVEYLVPEGRQLRRRLALHLLHRRVIEGRGEDRHQRRCVAVVAPGPFIGFQGIGEGRRRRIGGDPLDLGAVARHGGLEGWREMGCLDPAEGRRPATGTAPRGEHGVVGDIGHARES